MCKRFAARYKRRAGEYFRAIVAKEAPTHAEIFALSRTVRRPGDWSFINVITRYSTRRRRDNSASVAAYSFKTSLQLRARGKSRECIRRFSFRDTAVRESSAFVRGKKVAQNSHVRERIIRRMPHSQASSRQL